MTHCPPSGFSVVSGADLQDWASAERADREDDEGEYGRRLAAFALYETPSIPSNAMVLRMLDGDSDD